MVRQQMVAAAELIEDFDLYPRDDVNSVQVTKLLQALEAGEELPPIVVCRKTKRIVDGFHRRRAYIRWRGEAMEVPVHWKDYPNDAALFEDAVRCNSMHGLHLDSQSRTRVTIIAERLGIPLSTQAAILHVTEEEVKKISVKVVLSKSTSEPIPIKPVAKFLQGKTITRAQEEALEHFGGLSLLGTITQVRQAVEAKLYDREDEKVILALHELARLICETVPELTPA